ncbi:MAG: hypothetical protein Q8P92_03545 [Candidatus Daviesbacteria bacterium]|nr:hypothetical protein [Candidatus Daviesbacteria bacterium]
MTCEQDQKIPPIEWYGAFAWTEEGIRRVLKDIIVKQLTGFHPEVLMQRERDLENEYKGRSMGPFLLEVYWTN